MISIAIAASVLTVRPTATRITAATVAPTCGMRSSRPVMMPSTIGNGSPKIYAETPAMGRVRWPRAQKRGGRGGHRKHRRGDPGDGAGDDRDRDVADQRRGHRADRVL